MTNESFYGEVIWIWSYYITAAIYTGNAILHNTRDLMLLCRIQEQQFKITK